MLQHSPATSFSGAAPLVAMDGHVYVLTRGPMVPLAADTLSSFGTVANVNALRDAMGLTKADPAVGDVAEPAAAEAVVAEAAATEVETTTAIATVPAEASGVDEGMPPIATTVLSHPAGVTTAVPVSAQLMAQVTQEQLAAAYAAYGMSPPPPGAALQAMMMCQASYAAVVPGAAVAPPAKPVSSRRSGSVTKQGWSREEDEKIMDAYKEKGARPAPHPRFHARALPKCTCALNMHPNARARSMRRRETSRRAHPRHPSVRTTHPRGTPMRCAAHGAAAAVCRAPVGGDRPVARGSYRRRGAKPLPAPF